jgi:transketolase
MTQPPGDVAEAPFGGALAALGAEFPELVVLSADLSKYTDVQPFAAAYPDRFFQMGMAEQNMMGVAGGLAKTGLIPVATTYCVFASRRSFEQVALALCTARRPAVIAAFLPGISTPFRATHQGTDDLALMRTIPGMTVVDPLDATELAAALPAAVALGGPVYMRGQRGQVPRYFPPGAHDFRIGETYLLREGNDVGLIGTGLGTRWALEAADILTGRGVSAAVLHVPTLKPLDGAAVSDFARRFPAIATVENHSVVGGLGSAVAETLAEAGTGTRLRRLGVPDVWAPAGSLDYIRTELGLDGAAIAASVQLSLDPTPGAHR